MQEYRISREEMLHWCSIPKEELAQHPESKVQHFIMKKLSLIHISEPTRP